MTVPERTPINLGAASQSLHVTSWWVISRTGLKLLLAHPKDFHQYVKGIYSKIDSNKKAFTADIQPAT